MESKFQIGNLVCHSELHHVRCHQVGAIESINEFGWYQVWWEADGDTQIHPAHRTYEEYELKLAEDNLAP